MSLFKFILYKKFNKLTSQEVHQKKNGQFLIFAESASLNFFNPLCPAPRRSRVPSHNTLEFNNNKAKEFVTGLNCTHSIMHAFCVSFNPFGTAVPFTAPFEVFSRSPAAKHYTGELS